MTLTYEQHCNAPWFEFEFNSIQFHGMNGIWILLDSIQQLD